MNVESVISETHVSEDASSKQVISFSLTYVTKYVILLSFCGTAYGLRLADKVIMHLVIFKMMMMKILILIGISLTLIRRLKMYWDTIKKISWVGFLLRIWVQDLETMDHFYQCNSALLLFCPIQQPKATLVQSALRIHHQIVYIRTLVLLQIIPFQ